MEMTPTTNNWSRLERLPTELLLKIVLCLPIKDLKSVSLASHRLYDITSTEELWKNAVISKYQVRKNGVQPVLRTRYKSLVSLDLSGIFCLSTEDLTEIMTFIRASSIKSVNLSFVRIESDRPPRQMPCNKALSKVEANLLADAVNALESVNLSGTYLETLQIVAIFEKILVATKLIKLVFGGINLVGVPTDLIVNALSEISQVEVFETNVCHNGVNNSFTDSQIFGLFRKLEEATILRILSVSWWNFGGGCAFLEDVQFCTIVNKRMNDSSYGSHILNK